MIPVADNNKFKKMQGSVIEIRIALKIEDVNKNYNKGLISIIN